ncbi:G patch domain-containing protein 4 [Pygocentrus nattereri]|uniref:G patch domain-containing protein 4 n=1 Tax=Pygocentrus nattereri TaxID=42514 RepID=A0A3B4DUH0_PYGNA|nr:G patch domain-containing protein 4 [Pygocentrus nattereri]
MAVAMQEKGRGLRFAEQQLLRHGWEHGKGLGKGENGISEAIKVKVKCDKRGVGHKEGEQFTFHWWDHVFNKASSNLAVESGQDGVVLKKVEEEEEEGMISNKKPRKASLNKSSLYGCFVKSATLLSGQEHPESRSFSSDDSSSSDDEKLDLSSTTKLSDKALMKACGGRTAHKGARHGFTMSAKLARLEQQEQEFMAKYGKKMQTAKTTSQNEDPPCSTESSCMVAKTKHKKSKKKNLELLDNCAQEGDTSREVAQIHLNDATSKKHKKRSKEKPSEMPDVLVDNDETVNSEKKIKRDYFKNVMVPLEEVNGSILLDEDPTKTFEQCEGIVAAEMGETAHPLTGDRVSKKGKKKKKKHSKQRSALEEELSENNVVASEDLVDTKMSHGQEQQEKGSFVLQSECNSVPMKKKKKSSKSNREESLATELESPSILESSTIDMSITAENMETAAREREKSKSKKRKLQRGGSE